MAPRSTGFALLCSASVQEAHDLALISTRASLERAFRLCMHFFDGFRTSHEVQKVELITDEDLRSLIPDELIFSHHSRALTPDNPVIRRTAQNPHVYAISGGDDLRSPKLYWLKPDKIQYSKGRTTVARGG